MRPYLFSALSAAFLLAASCSPKIPPYGDIPPRIKVVHPSVNIRTNPDGQSAVLAIAQTGETYRVLDAIPAYYKITLPTGASGWISANPIGNWTTRIDENLVKVLLEGGIAVREKPFDRTSPQIGIAAQGYTFDILAVEYSHYKVLLPNGKKGWIYAGRPDQRLVEPLPLP